MRPCVLVPQNIRNLLQEYNKRMPLSLEEQMERAVNAKVLEVEGKNLTAVFTSHIGATLSNLPDDLRFQPPTLPFRYTARKDKVEVIPSQKQTHTARADLRKRWEPILREAGGSAEDAEMFYALTGLNAPATIEGTIEHIGKTLSGLLTEDGIRWTPSFAEATTPAFDFYIASTLKNYAGYIEELQRRGKATPLLENALPLIRAGAQRFEKRYFSVAKQGREITKTTVSKTVFDKIDLDLAEEQFLSAIHPHLARPISPLRSVLAKHYGVAPDKAPLAFFIDVYEEQVRNLGGYAKYEEVKDTLFFRRLKWALHTALGNEYKTKGDEIELIAKSIIEGRPDPRVKVIYDYQPFAPASAEVVEVEAVRVLPDIPDAYTTDGLREAYRQVQAVVGNSEEKDAVIGVLNLKRVELNIPYADATDYIGTLADRVKDTSKLPNLSPSASKLVAENLAVAEDVAEQLLSQDKIRFEKYKQIQEARKYYEKRAGVAETPAVVETPTVREEPPAVREEPPRVVEETQAVEKPAERRVLKTEEERAKTPTFITHRYKELKRKSELLGYEMPEDELRYYPSTARTEVRSASSSFFEFVKPANEGKDIYNLLREKGLKRDVSLLLYNIYVISTGDASDPLRSVQAFEKIAEQISSRNFNGIVKAIRENTTATDAFLVILENTYNHLLRITDYDPALRARVEKAFKRILDNTGYTTHNRSKQVEEQLKGKIVPKDNISELFKENLEMLKHIINIELTVDGTDLIFDLLTFKAIDYSKKSVVNGLKQKQRSLFKEARERIKERATELPPLPPYTRKALETFENHLRDIAQKSGSWVAEELADTIRTLLDEAPKRDFFFVDRGLQVDVFPMPEFSINFLTEVRIPLEDFLVKRLGEEDAERILRYLGYDVLREHSVSALTEANKAGLFKERLKEFFRALYNGEIREVPDDVILALEEIYENVSKLVEYGYDEATRQAFAPILTVLSHLRRTNEYLDALRRGEDVFEYFANRLLELFNGKPPAPVYDFFDMTAEEYVQFRQSLTTPTSSASLPAETSAIRTAEDTITEEPAPTVRTAEEAVAEEPTPAVMEEPTPTAVEETVAEEPPAVRMAEEPPAIVEEPAPTVRTAEELIEEQAITPEEFVRQADEGFNAPPPETPSVEDFPDEPREYLSFAEYAEGQSALLRDYLFEQRGLMQGNEEVLNLALNAVDAYFVSNGKFEEVMSALQSLTSTSLRASSEVEITEKLRQNSRFLKVEDGVLTLKDPDALKGRVAELRAEVPILYFFDDETVAGYAIIEDFIGALADGNNRNVLEVLRDALPYRVLNPNRIEEIPTIIVALAGVMRTDDREKAIRGIEALLNRFTEEEINEMKRKLSEMVAVGTMSAVVRTAFDVVPILEFKDGRLTKDEFNALSDDAKRALFLRTIQNEDEWNYFALNFTDDPVALRNAVLQGTTTETVLRHPYLLDALMTYSREMGFSPIGLTAGAKIIRNHLDAMRRIFFHHKVPAPMKMMLEEYGGNALRLLYSELGTALQASGQREAEFLLRDVMQRSTPSARVSGEVVEEVDDDVFAFEVLKNLLGMPNDIDGMPALKRAIHHATNVVFPLKALYQEAVAANIGEELIPLLSAFSEQGLLNQIISPVATGLSQVPLRPLLRRAYGEYAEDSMRFIVDSLDPHMRALYYTYQQAGRGHEFELYVPQIVADIIAKPDFLNAKNLLDALNNAFKSVLIVYNPPAILRNAFTNTMLLYHIGYDKALEMPFMKGVKAQLDAWNELKQGTQLVRELEDLDPSLSLLRTYERLAEWEVINNFDARAVRAFRYISNLPFLRNLHYVQSMSEASAKVAAIKELLKARGKLNNYTREDLMQAITEVNEWLINYRVVPPAVHFLRKSLGLFPFITFTLTTMVNFARHPDRFMKEAFRATIYKERFSNVMGALFGEPTMQPLPQATQRASLHNLLPEYMRNNPLIVATPTGRDKLSVMDLSFWLPIGVFEQQTGVGMPIPVPQLAPFVALANPHDTIKRYMGGVVRPFAELVLNKQLLTDTPIVDENLPISEQMKQRGSFLVRNIPFIRLVLETAGVDELTPLGKTRTNEPIDKMTAWLGLRGYHISELEMTRLKALEAKARDIQKAMSNLFKNANLSAQRKAEIFRAYQEELENTLRKYEQNQMYYVPMFFRVDEDNATLINSPAEFQSTVLGLYAQRRWQSMDEFNAEMFQDLSVFDEVPFGEPMIGGEADETAGE